MNRSVRDISNRHPLPLPRGIRGRLFLLIALVLIPMVLLVGRIYHQRYQNRQAQAVQTEWEVARGVASAFLSYLEGVRQMNRTVGQGILAFDPYTSRKAASLLGAAAENYPAVRNLSWVDPGGNVLASSDPEMAGLDLSDRPFLRELFAGGAWSLGDLLQAGRASGVPTLVVAAALGGPGGDLRGVVLAGIEPTRLGEYALNAPRPAGGTFAVFDRQGTVVYRNPEISLSWEERTGHREKDPLLRQVLETGMAAAGTAPLSGEVEWMMALVPVGQTGFVAGAARPASIALAPVRQRLLLDLVLALLIASAAFALAVYVARTISAPLRRLEEDARFASFGGIEGRGDLRAPTEVRLLRDALAQMSRDLLHRSEVLRESEERFRTLADHIAQLAWMADEKGDIFWYNRRWFEYTGTTPEEMRGRGWQKVHHPDHLQRVREKIEACFRNREPWEDTFPLRGSDGGYRWFLSRAVPILDDRGAVRRWFGTNTDITDQLQIQESLREAKEAAESGNRAKDRFLLTMSHELRTPLTVIMGMLELALAEKLPPDQRRYLETARTSSENLLTLISDILDFSAVGQGGLLLEEKEFGLRDCLLRAAEPCADRAREKGIRFELTLDPSLPRGVMGDCGRLQQVLGNILGNAVRFTDRGEVALSARCGAEREDRGREVVIEVRDTGVGISEETLAHVFDRFSQGDMSLTRRFGGAGLGLTLSRALVERMGGRIEVRSQPGEGSTFSIVVPFRLAEKEERVLPEREAPPPVPPPRRILVADDEPMILELLRTALESRGWQTDLAGNGREALEKWEAGDYGLILMDLQMPGMDGLEAARAIRGREQGTHIPIVAVTAHAREEDRQACHEAGMDDVVFKPLHMGRLMETVQRQLAAAEVVK